MDDTYGIGGRNTTGNANLTLSTYFPGAVFVKNVLAGAGSSANWPGNNFFPAGLDAVGFVNRTGGDYHLAATSPYKNAGTDGKDLGADIDALDAATACTLDGACTSAPSPDVTPPSVAMAAPPAGSTVAGTVTVSASASDDVGVVGVQFRLDGTNLGAEVSAPPYTVAWTTTLVSNGTHTLRAVARDAAGNTATSDPVTVIVSNLDTTPPTVTITSPTSNPTYTTSSASLTLGGTASDNVGVTQVTWQNTQGGGGTASGTTSWTASGVLLQPGTNVLTVTARDAAGNTATDSLTVTLTATFTFTDDPLTAQTTLVRAVHIPELRAAIDSLRVARGLAAFVWTDPTLTPGSTPARAVHLTELRSALNQAYQAAGRVLPVYTDPTVAAGVTIVKTIHLNELRTAVRAL
jgi:hypothetical protein